MMQRYFLLLLSLVTLAAFAQPHVVAHRGYWKTDGSAQNSIASFQKAAEAGCWGSEFDVWLTADGVPVVFHDATVEGIRIEDTTYATLMNIRLKNGEFIPTLQQYLMETLRWSSCRLMRKILMLTTGGTIASVQSPDGLVPGLTSEQLRSYLPQIGADIDIDIEELFQLS